MTSMTRLTRFLMAFVVGLLLLGGLGSGLARLGWSMDGLSEGWIAVHGPLMICGFMGTVICLERAVALASRYRWSVVVPLINAAGAVLLLIMPAAVLPRLVLLGGSLGLVVLFGLMLRQHRSRDLTILAVGAVCWCMGNLLWAAQQPIYRAVHWWCAFLILTIVGERLELSRVRRLSRAQENALTAAIGVYLGGLALTLISLDAGLRVLGVGALLMAAWLLRCDIARRTIRRDGLPRYIAACLLLGYAWLGAGGTIAILSGALYAGPVYAALLHAFLLGFVFSMIFGHAPIILPALTRLRLEYHPVMYGPLALLHLSLAYRVISNLSGERAAMQWSGLFNVVAVLVFVVTTLGLVATSNRAVTHSHR